MKTLSPEPDFSAAIFSSKPFCRDSGPPDNEKGFPISKNATRVRIKKRRGTVVTRGPGVWNQIWGFPLELLDSWKVTNDVPTGRDRSVDIVSTDPSTIVSIIQG